MKKLLIILAACFVLTSCQWIAENIYTTEDCIEWYADEIYDAAQDDDRERVIELYTDMFAYIAKLDKAEQIKAMEAANRWDTSNPYKSEFVEEYVDDLGF